MKLSRWVLVPSVALAGLLALAPLALAQTAPAWHIATNADGVHYLVTGAGRYTLSPGTLSADDLAILPDLGTLGADLPSQPAPVRQSTQLPVTLTGQGTLNTRAIDLQAGNYTAAWVAVIVPGHTSCFHGANLRPVAPIAGFYNESLGSGSVDNGLPGSGETQIYNVPTGQYFVDASSTCGWSITISPQT